MGWDIQELTEWLATPPFNALPHDSSWNEPKDVSAESETLLVYGCGSLSFVRRYSHSVDTFCLSSISYYFQKKFRVFKPFSKYFQKIFREFSEYFQIFSVFNIYFNCFKTFPETLYHLNVVVYLSYLIFYCEKKKNSSKAIFRFYAEHFQTLQVQSLVQGFTC